MSSSPSALMASRRGGKPLEPRETWTRGEIVRYIEWLKTESPELSDEELLRSHCEKRHTNGLFYKDKHGKRCVWGPGLNYYDLKASKSWWYHLVHAHTRHFMVLTRPLTLQKVDQPKSLAVTQAVAHRSESGWGALQPGHQRHFLSFPKEIQNMIIHYATTAPEGEIIYPKTMVCNWKTEWQVPDFCFGPSDCHHDDTAPVKTSVIISAARQDRLGPYTEYRAVQKKILDASLLRVNKLFYMAGINALYSHSFIFEPSYRYYRRLHPSILHGNVYRDSHFEDEYNRDHPTENLDNTVNAVRNQLPLEKLGNLIYYSSFLRWLHFIGPENCLRQGHLLFSGYTKIHDCRNEDTCDYKNCQDDLVETLRSYIPFIKELCENVHTITLIVREDKVSLQNLAGGAFGTPMNRAEALLPLLENELRTLPHLRFLSVVNEYQDEENLDFAEPAIKWFRERDNEAFEAYKSQHRGRILGLGDEDVMVTCEFCKEVGHVWADCYNLCNFCGDYGHKRHECAKAVFSAERFKTKRPLTWM